MKRSLILMALIVSLVPFSGCKKKPAPAQDSTLKKPGSNDASPEVKVEPTNGSEAKAPAADEAKTPVVPANNPEPTAKVAEPASKKGVETSTPTAPELNLQTTEEFVATLRKELEATSGCEKKTDSVAPKNINECLSKVFAVKKASWTPPKATFPDWNAKKALREALGGVFAEMLGHKDLTVRYSALRTGWSSLDNSAGTYQKLEKMLSHDDKDLAEQAAYARFNRKLKDDTATLELAKTVLKAHKHERVRLQGCRYIGNRSFQGNRPHFNLLTGYGRDEKEAKAVRACAVSQLGVLGSDKDIPKIMRFMSEPDLHYAVVYALGRGIRTKKAFDAYLNYFLKHASSGKLSSSPFTIFIPGKRDLDKFDRVKAVKVLIKTLKSPSDNKFWVPSLLGKLGAKKELETALKGIGDTANDWNKQNLKNQIVRALKIVDAKK